MYYFKKKYLTASNFKLFFAFLLVCSTLAQAENTATLSLKSNNIDMSQIGMPIMTHYDTMAVNQNPQNFSIKQDEKGFIYVGNGSGLLVYDGVSWRAVSRDKQQPVRSFALSSDGKIHAGSNGDLGFFSSDIDGVWRFTSLLNKQLDKPKTPEIYQVLFIGSHVFYLSRYRLYHYHPSKGTSWIEKEVLALADDGKKLTFSTRDKKLYRFDPDQEVLKELTIEGINSPTYLIGFLELKNGRKITYSRTKIYYREKISSLQAVNTDIDDWLNGQEITHIIELPDTNLAIGTLKGGVAIISQKGELQRFYNTNHGLKSNNASFLFIDREDDLWISSASNGVTRIELNSPISYFSSDTKHAISLDVVNFGQTAVMGAFDGVYELISATNLHEQAQFRKLDVNIEGAMELLVVDDELLIGHFHGINSLSKDSSGNYQIKTIHDSRKDKGRYVHQLLSPRSDPNIIYGTTDNGLIQLQKINGDWVSNGLTTTLKDALYSVHEDEKGRLWVGSNLGQFYQVDQLENWPEVSFSVLDYPLAEFPTMATMYSLGKHSLFDNGYKDGTKILSDDGYHLNDVHITNWREYGVSNISLFFQKSLTSDAWFLITNEITGSNIVGLLKRINDKNYQVDFSKLDHLGLNFTMGLNETNNGVLWISGRDKTIRYDTRMVVKLKQLLAPLVTKISRLGTGEILFVNNDFGKKNKEFELLPDESAIRLYYSSVEYSHSQTTEYRYRVDGQWSEWNKNTDTELTGIIAGKTKVDLQYRFNPKDVSPMTSIELNRLPFWYQSWWGIALVMSLIVSLMLLGGSLFIRYQSRNIRKRATELKSQVNERTLVIQKQCSRLRKAEEAKTRFFTKISHEFRTQLTLSIEPLKEMLADKNIPEGKNKNYLETALRNNLHMMDLLGQVLDINKLESVEMPVNISKVNLPVLLAYCICRFELLTDKQDVKFKTIGFDDDFVIYFDAGHFEKIILNLLNNAIKYSPCKSTIQLGIKNQGEQVLVWVKDQGIGISSDEQQHIFDRFYQGVNSSDTIQPGTGIGLALVKELVELHDATIRVDSEVGKGSCFTISFPIRNSHYEPQLKKQYDNDSTLSENNLSEIKQIIKNSKSSTKNSRKTILVVDDNIELRKFISNILQPQYLVLQAENGLIGYGLALEKLPDLIVSDIMMPVMDGFQFAKKLKSSPETDYIPLILLTAKSTKQDTIFGLQQGADDYLVKPFDGAELSLRITALIKQKQRVAAQLMKQFKSVDNNGSQQICNINDSVEEGSDPFELKLNSLLKQKMGEEGFDVEQICNGMNISRSTLARYIRKRFDCTASHYLKIKRLTLSLEMLQKHSGSISEIAYAVGFISLSSYSRAFKEQYGVPPTRFEDLS